MASAEYVQACLHAIGSQRNVKGSNDNLNYVLVLAQGKMLHNSV